MPCPRCGKISKSIKDIRLPKLCIFLLCFLRTETYSETCCRTCMLKQILYRCFTYNIFTANLYWVIVIFPLAVINLISLLFRGHSKRVIAYLYNTNYRKEGEPPMII